MRVFLTGASGFLGKRVLDLLTQDSRIDRIDVVSRRKQTHPDPRVRTHQFDLAQPWAFQDFLKDTDAIIHLAGLYNFAKPFSENYRQNVLPVLNLVDRVRELKPGHRPQIQMASTYAIGFGAPHALEEVPLSTLPPTHQGYAYTKAVAERALTDSGLAARIFRLGILVGDTQKGVFEKIDGPYSLMRLLKKAQRFPLLHRIRKLPLPYSPSGLLPLVPVDSAAEIFHRALFLEPLKDGQQDFFGLFNSKSVSIEDLTRSLLQRYLPNTEPRPIRIKVAPWLQRQQFRLTGVPKELFNFSYAPVALSNSRFREVFGEDSIPHFNDYRETFFRGFDSCMNLH